jgi:5-carboxymethyl-2-hydroxymuconate isomerase
MPHLRVEYSANLEDSNITALCAALSDGLAASGIFPLGGIRVRAYPAAHIAIADHHPENSFADMVLRIGTGRSETEKKTTGDALMAIAARHFAGPLKGRHFALSLEIVEIGAALSWKVNTIHPRLHGEVKDQP